MDTEELRLQLERDRDRRDQAEARRGWALYGFLVATAVSIGWAMWRLDDRAERLFVVVSQSRAAGAGCP